MILKLDIFNTSEVAGKHSPAYSISLPDGMNTSFLSPKIVEKQVEIPGAITHYTVDVERQYEPEYQTVTREEVIINQETGEEETIEVPYQELTGKYFKPVFGEEKEIISFELVDEPGTYKVQVDQVVQADSTYETVEVEELEEIPMTPEELIYEKYRYLTEQSGYTYAYADEFLSEEDIDLSFPQHLANTGVKLIELLPQGMCITKPIALDAPADKFELYLEADEGVSVLLHEVEEIITTETVMNENGEEVQQEVVTSDVKAGIDFDTSLVLAEPITKFCLSFHNTTDSKVKVYAYAMFYEGA